MKPLKKIISENVVNPLQHFHGQHMMLARVVESDDAYNMCEVEYIDQMGYGRKRALPVRSTDPNGWFPDKDDLVITEEIAGTMYITGPHTEQYIANWRYKNELKYDIYDLIQTDTLPGNIL